MVPVIQDVKQIMNDHGAGGKPLWNTESGWSKPKPFPSDELAAVRILPGLISSTGQWSVERLLLVRLGQFPHGWVSIETTEADNRNTKARW